MRTCYTLFVSMLAHVGAIAIVAVTTIVAADALPPVRRAVDWIVVTPAVPPVPPPVRRVIPSKPEALAAIPLAAPDGVHEERATPPPDPSTEIGESIVPGLGESAVALPEPLPPAAKAVPQVLRVGGAIQPPRKLFAPPPAYPRIARDARKDGIVILEAVIGEDGSVRDVRVLRAIPLLDQAAVDAVRQWRFTPTLLNGEPVSVVMTVTVGFTLN